MILAVLALTVPVAATSVTAPAVPDAVREYMPSSTENFGAGLMEVLGDALAVLQPELKQAGKLCVGILAGVMLTSVLKSFPSGASKTVDVASVGMISMILMDSTGSMIKLAAETVRSISEYGKLLLPVMTGALASQGGITASVALYSGTVIFSTLLSNLITSLLIPLVYFYLALSVATAVTEEEILKNIRDMIKKFMTWCLKTILYIFTGFIGITRVISGTTDAATLKAAKMTISGVVPVVGGILSDASEAVLVSAGLVKNAAGIYGLFATLAIWLGPFLKTGSHYLMLKATAALGSVVGTKRATDLIDSYSGAMGLLVAMTGSVCMMLIISTVCYMKGVG